MRRASLNGGSQDGSPKQVYKRQKTRDTIGHVVPRLPDGKVLRFIGSRVLPPSTHSVEVVFCVNGGPPVAAMDMPRTRLYEPKTVIREAAEDEASPRKATKAAEDP